MKSLMVACSGGGKDRGERIVREFGMIMYTLIYLKCITNKGLLNSMWNSVQCCVAGWVRGEFEGEWRHVEKYHVISLICGI